MLPRLPSSLSRLVALHGPQKWTQIAEHLPGRIGKQCRERCVWGSGRGRGAVACQAGCPVHGPSSCSPCRPPSFGARRWHNHLNPSIKRGQWVREEDEVIVRFHRRHGNQARTALFSPAVLSRFLRPADPDPLHLTQRDRLATPNHDTAVGAHGAAPQGAHRQRDQEPLEQHAAAQGGGLGLVERPCEWVPPGLPCSPGRPGSLLSAVLCLPATGRTRSQHTSMRYVCLCVPQVEQGEFDGLPEWKDDDTEGGCLVLHCGL